MTDRCNAGFSTHAASLFKRKKSLQFGRLPGCNSLYDDIVQDVYHERETRFLLFGKTSSLARAIVFHFDGEKFDTS